MGGKFYNLNVFRGNLDSLQALRPDLTFFQVAPDWITVVAPGFSWGNIQPVAKFFSKETGNAVLSTEYFDDDFVEFSVYEDGKLLTRHIPVAYEDIPRKKGSAKAFLSAFHMNLIDEAPFKKALASEDCEESVALVESFLGCPILGVRDDTPPDAPPDRAAADQLRGGKQEVEVHTQYNPFKVDASPYLYNPEQPTFSIGVQSTCCFTDQPEKVIKKVKNYVDLLRKDFENMRWRYKIDDPYCDPWGRRNQFTILCLPGRTIIQGVGFGCADACAPDDSRFYRSLVMLTSLEYGHGCANLNLAMAYAGKLLCHGVRGMPPKQSHNKVIENLTLKSPWLTLADGVLPSAFQQPCLGETVEALEELLGVVITPIDPNRYSLMKEYGCLRVYQGDL